MTAELLLDPTARPIIAHRGASGLAPENTTAAFDLAVDQGAEAFELDVRLSADGVAVVLHDPTLDRTTDRTGLAAALPASGVTSADAGARFTLDGGATYPFRDRGVHVPTLRRVLERYPDTPLLVELKVTEAAATVRDEIARVSAQGRVVVASFSDRALEGFRQAPYLAGASRRSIAALAARSWAGLRPKSRGDRLFAVPRRYRNLVPVPTRRFVAAAHRLGCPVHVWTVNDPGVARELWNRGANGMITNDPARMVEARSGWVVGSGR